jgi:hypothetical protein
VPASVGDDRGKDDHADPPGEHVPPHHGKSRQHDHEDEDLADFNADVECEERDQQMGPGELEVLLEAVRETEAVHKSKQARDNNEPPDGATWKAEPSSLRASLRTHAIGPIAAAREFLE